MAVSANNGPLAGIKVIDFGHYIAGPGAAMMLADQGAEVIRIERPAGNVSLGASIVLNRGKQTIVLDLKSSDDCNTAKNLIASADVVIENFRPGVMDRLGLGAKAMAELNPRLIYLSLPGFSAEDEAHANIPAWEGVVAAAMGQFTDMGLNRVLMGIEASYSPLTLASAYASVIGVMSVTLALRARIGHGQGEHIEVPLAAALMEGLVYNSLLIDALPERYKSLRELEIERRQANGLPMDLKYKELQPFLDPFYRTYFCKDGRPFYLVSEAHETHSIRALQVLGLWEEMLAAGVPLQDPYIPTSEWPEGINCTLKAYPIAEPWAALLSERIAEKFLTKDSFEWERLFGEAGAPAAAHRTTKEWLHSDHAREAGLVFSVNHSDFGPVLQPAPVSWLKGCPPVVGPQQGQSSDNASRPKKADTVTSHAQSGDATGVPTLPWLDGVTILDMTNVIAGPTIAGTLARFGARVIKLDAVKPMFDPYLTAGIGIYANLGKESVLVDVKSPEGKEVLKELIQQVDVVTINASNKQLASLGMTFEELSAINPRVILCQLDAFGGTLHGPRSDYPGYDDLVQASTGIMERFGGSMNTVEEHAHFGTIDVLAGFCGAFATAMALLRRESTGKGDVARTSLAAAGQWLQSRFMYDFEGRPPFDESRGRETKGEGPLYRCYRAKDRWFFFAAPTLDLRELSSSSLLNAASSIDPALLEGWFERVFETQTLSFWQGHLSEFNVAVQPLEALSKLRAAGIDSSLNAHTISFQRDVNHPCGRNVEHIKAAAVRPRYAQIVGLATAEKYGSSTARVMNELGYSKEKINELLNNKIISDSWSAHYLPD